MAEGGDGGAADLTAIQVAVRVRPINDRERGEGHRTCVSFDEPTKQVVLTAVDKSTLLQLRGASAKGYAFDRRYDQNATSDDIYDDCIAQLVENCFKGYNGTVLAYGQTGSGKTHTMSGGVGIHGKREEGVTPRVIRHLFQIVEQLNKKAKPGEKVEISASALELYNEELLDLSIRSGKDDTGGGWNAKAGAGQGLKLTERPVGKDGRVVPEVVGIREMRAHSVAELSKFYSDCMENRSTSSTKLNDASSRSHALFTITIHRTMVEVLSELGDDFKARVRNHEFSSKLHLVDLAGSERVKRSGVTGKELKEATHINSGLLALGNVIVALSSNSSAIGAAAGGGDKKKTHVPYRDSKLTRLLQDSLGGNSLTVLISCCSPSEMDFEETNNTLKYANRACSIKNTPLPNKFTTLEEDLLPCVPQAGGLGLVQLQALLEDHERMKEFRERKDRERKEKDAKRAAALMAMREEQTKQKGYQRLRASQYDELRRALASRGATNIPQGQVIGDDMLASFGRSRLSQSVDGLNMPSPTASSSGAAPAAAAAAAGGPLGSPTFRRPKSRAGMDSSMAGSLTPTRNRRQAGVAQSVKLGGARAPGQSFHDWLAAQQGADEVPPLQEGVSQNGAATDLYEHEEGGGNDESSFIIDDHEEDSADGVAARVGGLQLEDSTHDSFIVDDADQPHNDGSTFHVEAHVGRSDEAAAAPGPATPAGVTKSKFRRAASTRLDDASAAVGGPSATAPGSPGTQSLIASEAGASSMDVQAGSVAYAESEQQAYQHSTGGGGAEEGSGLTAEQYAAEEEDEVGALADDTVDDGMPYDPIEDNVPPKLLARFKVNVTDTLAVFKAVSKEDFADVVSLLPENTPLPASDKMTYLLARLEVSPQANRDLPTALCRVAAGEATMNEAVGPAVGCLMATFGTNMISSCIFEFPDPEELKFYDVDERIELWGLQIPHNSVRPQLADEEQQQVDEATAAAAGQVITWTSVDRLSMSIGLLYALCNYALDNGIRCGFCVPRPQLLKRWMQAGVCMKQITSLNLIYPSSAHDYEYYKASTVAYFMINEVRAALEKVLAVVKANEQPLQYRKRSSSGTRDSNSGASQ